jgi:hypothetical protein
MQHHASTPPATIADLVGTLWIDQAHHHRLVEIIRIVDGEHVRLQPIRQTTVRPASYVETKEQLSGHAYQPVTA